MEPLPPSIAPATAPAPPPAHHVSYPDSVDSSPRSRNTDSWDEPLPPAANRLRLMCSYGGHIVPRPHDKSLCYVGGDTRIVVVDRNTSLSDLTARLSKTLLNGRSFTLKYQLPSEDLDSLISVTTDEDLDNMIDEYDRTGNGSGSAAKPSRLRLFLFPTKPESSQSIGPILDNPAKSEDWFLNALNGATGMINRGFSDSASVNCLLGLDDEVGGGGGGSNVDSGSRDVEISQPGIGSFGNGKSGKLGILQDVHSVPDSPMLETTSSFGSTSSSPSLANLPPIRVHVEDVGGVRLQDQKLGLEEQFAQMNIGQVGVKPDESGFVVLSSPPPLPTTIVASAMPVSSATVVVDYTNRVISDDERSDHGAPIVYRKQPLSQPLSQPVSQPQALPLQSHQKSSAGLELPSPDSVSSDSSIGNALSRQKPVIYQEQVVQIPSGPARVLPNPVDPKVNISDPNTRVQLQQQVQDSGYVLQPQFDPKQQIQQQQQQQFVHAGAHYVHHHPAGSVPISAYYPVYPSQQQHHPHHHHQQQLDPQYSVYYVPARQAEAYNNMSVQQSNISGAATTIPSNHPQTHSNPTMAPPPHSYNPIRNPPISKPESAAGMYRTATTVASPPLVQVPSAQHQQQYVGYSQIHHPSQSVAPTSAATANYAYEYTDPAHSPIYYTQPLAPTMSSQYQTMTGNAGVVMPEVSAQHPADNLKHQQHARTSQPL